MKKHFLILTIAAVLVFSCTTEKQVGSTILGDGTPYANAPEIMIGKVKTVVEKNYWTLPDGDSYKKGNPLTQADRDSLGGWTDDYEAVYDDNGVIIVCTGLDEKNTTTWKNESIIENKLVAKRNFIRKDTIRFYDQFKYDEKGFLVGGSRSRSVVDTLMVSVTVKTNEVGYPTEIQLYNPKGKPIEKYIQTYDDQNRFIKLEVYDKDEIKTFNYEVKYNDKSKVSELKIEDKVKNIAASNYFTYEYDEKGNWVKAIVKDDENHVVIEERTYTYFE